MYLFHLTCFCDPFFIRHVFTPVPVHLTTQVLHAILTCNYQTFNIALSALHGFLPKWILSKMFTMYTLHISQNPLSSLILYKLCRHSSLFYHFRAFLLYWSSQCETNIKKFSLTKKFPPLLLRAQQTPKVNISQITRTGCGCIIRHLQYLQYRE